MDTKDVLSEQRLSIVEAARALDVHTSTIHRWIKSGVGGRKLRAVRIGGRSFVPLSELKAFLVRSNVDPAS